MLGIDLVTTEHLFGNVCEMDAIMNLANKYKLKVIEDNAQAQGAIYHSKLSASIGHINSTSFYPDKNLGAIGDAGMVSTNDEHLARMARSLRNYGSSRKYINEHIGMNSRLDEMQAALLTVKLKHLDAWNQERIRIAKLYNYHLSDVDEIQLPELKINTEHVYHIYCIRTTRRNELRAYLEEKGIQTLIHYPVPPHLQQAYSFIDFKKGDFPIAESMAETSLSLPIYPGLKEEDLDYITMNIRRFFGRNGS